MEEPPARTASYSEWMDALEKGRDRIAVDNVRADILLYSQSTLNHTDTRIYSVSVPPDVPQNVEKAIVGLIEIVEWPAGWPNMNVELYAGDYRKHVTILFDHFGIDRTRMLRLELKRMAHEIQQQANKMGWWNLVEREKAEELTR